MLLVLRGDATNAGQTQKQNKNNTKKVLRGDAANAGPSTDRRSGRGIDLNLVGPGASGVYPGPGYTPAVHWQFGILNFVVFGRFSAKLGPQTPLERRGSSCRAGCTKNQPRRPILRPFRGNSEF